MTDWKTLQGRTRDAQFRTFGRPAVYRSCGDGQQYDVTAIRVNRSIPIGEGEAFELRPIMRIEIDAIPEPLQGDRIEIDGERLLVDSYDIPLGDASSYEIETTGE